MKMLLRDFGSCSMYLYVSWLWSFVVKRLWALWDNIYHMCALIALAMVMLLRESGRYGIIFMSKILPL
jgi:hypothetical protein